MRKMILTALAATLALPVAAAPADAQSWREVQRDRRDVVEARRDYRQAVRYGDRRDIRREGRDLRRETRDYRQTRRAYARDDWRGWRNQNRALYSRGNWRAPFRYQSYRPGVVLGRPLYAQRYWIADPWRYRLPPAGRGRWIRHYDDVLLVDPRNGRVLDAIRGFYW